MITIVDYGVGNLRAFLNVYKRLNIEACTATTPELLAEASHVILPGVGDFDQTMQRLGKSGIGETLEDLALNKRVPILGVCVGMQLLASSSEEGSLPGLGWISGRVKAFKSNPAACGLPLPHMGWNDVHPRNGGALFRHLNEDARFYFLHSFYFSCDHADDAAALAHYGTEFACAVQAENICGVQFHPEKSHHWGMQLLRNFALM